MRLRPARELRPVIMTLLPDQARVAHPLQIQARQDLHIINIIRTTSRIAIDLLEKIKKSLRKRGFFYFVICRGGSYVGSGLYPEP